MNGHSNVNIALKLLNKDTGTQMRVYLLLKKRFVYCIFAYVQNIRVISVTQSEYILLYNLLVRSLTLIQFYTVYWIIIVYTEKKDHINANGAPKHLLLVAI